MNTSSSFFNMSKRAMLYENVFIRWFDLSASILKTGCCNSFLPFTYVPINVCFLNIALTSLLLRVFAIDIPIGLYTWGIINYPFRAQLISTNKCCFVYSCFSHTVHKGGCGVWLKKDEKKSCFNKTPKSDLAFHLRDIKNCKIWP